MKVMEFLRMVKERQATADVMFEPLRGIINMLRLVKEGTPTPLIIRLEVDVLCVLFWTQPACFFQNQNT